jgi:hypothetical protein
MRQEKILGSGEDCLGSRTDIAAPSRHTDRQCSFIRELPAGSAEVSAAAKDALAKSLKKDLSLIVERRIRFTGAIQSVPFREHPG